MSKNIKHIQLFILTSALVLFSIKTNAQEVRVIDNKGTIQTINNNNVTTSTTAPVSPVENDVWFDTTNNIIKIYDTVDGWKDITNITPQNIYTTNGTLTGDRTLTGGSNSLFFTGLNQFQINNANFININSTNGFLALRARDGIDMLDSDVRITENLYVVGSYRDSNNDPGTAGQILSSTITGTDWVNPPQQNAVKTSAAQSTPADYITNVEPTYSPIENDTYIYTPVNAEKVYYVYDGSAWNMIAPTKAARVFYPPSYIIDASTVTPLADPDLELDLHELYRQQFASPAVSSTAAVGIPIPTYTESELYYYVTDFDTSILEINSIDDTGLMKYRIKATPTNDNTLINVVFVVK